MFIFLDTTITKASKEQMENPAVHRALSRCSLVARFHLDAIGGAENNVMTAYDFASCAVPVYHVPSRDERLRLALSRVVPEWESDHGVGVNSRRTSHRGHHPGDRGLEDPVRRQRRGPMMGITIFFEVF